MFSRMAPISPLGANDVNWVYRHGIMTGTGENAFEPAGEYTREQSIATMLRLYDAQYAVTVPEEAGEPYRVVVDYAGAGVGRVHIEDADGNRMLTDFEDMDGYFYDVTLFGDWASLRCGTGCECLCLRAVQAETGASLSITTATGWMYDAHRMRYPMGGRVENARTGSRTNIQRAGVPAGHIEADGRQSSAGRCREDIDRDISTMWRMNISLDQVEVYSW